MQLRDYQQKTIDNLYKFWEERPGEFPLVVIPTGGGKTIIFGSLIKRLKREVESIRILVLAHRAELITQAEDKTKKIWAEAPIGVFAASIGRKEIRSITVASRDSLVNALDYCGIFDLIIIDEAHNISPKEESGYQKIINHLRGENPRLMVVGFTATPYRTTGGLIYKTGGRFDKSKLFDGVAYEVKIKLLIDRGYLCVVVAPRTSEISNIDTTGIRTVNNDFVKKELEIAAEKTSVLNAALDEWERLSVGRKLTIFFCVSVHHAMMVSDMLAERGYIVPVLTGDKKITPKTKREKIIEDAENLRIHGIANVGVLTEGTDIPPIDCIAMLRPTKSLGLYVQMVGRGLRPSPETGKQDCLMLDFGGCIDRFGPIDIAQPPAEKAKDKRTKDCPKCSAIIGFYARKCNVCGEQFTPPPFKLCPECGQENAPTAAKCVACDHVFVSHKGKAGTGAILSSEAGYKPVEIRVKKVSGSLHKNISNGQPVIRITFSGGLMNYAYKTLLIGAPGIAGEAAKMDWVQLMKNGAPIPRNAIEAEQILRSGNFFRRIWKVKVNENDKQKEVTEILFHKGA
ncbi:DEAD/DEAH box helicase [Aliikangiella marina]|uniref:DEAD/DEAH box helicase n=1 Tax=Aliikangiella marina TaxID=1712262 RepID=A0A545THE4_9GAMM|nr:DEAD/DEAH box helicase [Aliikangiella marina]TQV76647.1 DEAD/DEAH box helicase [Aliikangiella marina]